MDDIAEIGVANHLFYEKKQETSRGRRDAILQGGCIYFDEAYERCRLFQMEPHSMFINYIWNLWGRPEQNDLKKNAS